MLGMLRGKIKQLRTLCTTLIKILFNKAIVTEVTKNISFTDKPGNWSTVDKCEK